MAAGGHVAFYGLDLRRPRITVAAMDGIDRAAVTLQLKQAYGRLRGIEAAARVIPVAEFRERLARITGIGRSILGEIERDPADAGRARRFLSLYLDSAERVTMEYARTHRGLRAQPLEERFRHLLTDRAGPRVARGRHRGSQRAADTRGAQLRGARRIRA
jgi:hypothetical protein